LRQQPHFERPSHQPPTPPEFLGETTPEPSSAPSTPRSGTVTPIRPTTELFEIHSDSDISDITNPETQKASNEQLFTTYAQHTPDYTSSPHNSSPPQTQTMFSHPFDFGAPFMNIGTPTDTLSPTNNFETATQSKA
jgi:hypothetical protein